MNEIVSSKDNELLYKLLLRQLPLSVVKLEIILRMSVL